MLEKEIEKYVRCQVKKLGGLCLKFVSPGNAGVPDRIVMLPGGRVWFVEFKQPGGRVKPLQAWWQNRLRRLGFSAQVVSSMGAAAEFIEMIRRGGGTA